MAFVHFSSIFCLYREREREKGREGGVRGRGRGRGREKRRGGGGEYIHGVLCMLPWFQYVLPL